MMLSRRLTTSLIRTCFAALTALTVCAGQAHSEPVANQLPSGGAVVAGSAEISQSGTAQAPVMTVQQNSDRAIVNWNSFNVGRDASVVFKQPDANSAILNRVLDANPSQIFGKLQSNGQVFLMNPSGVWFGKDASVDVGALFATTHSIPNDRFMSGVMRFERNGATGNILNAGSISAKLGGYIALLAPEVRNDGVLLAQSGSIMLAAGEAATLNFDPANSRVDLLVEPSRVNALIENRKLIKAPDGKVVVSAQAYNDIASGVIKNSGEIVATGIQSIGGKIVLGASSEVTSTGTLDASSRMANAGSVRIDADSVNNNGVINVRSDAVSGKGGEVIITGLEIALNDGSQINANGATGGGKVLVGGDWQGSGDLPQATKVTMSERASIDASAIQSGDGGTVVLWSDIRNPYSMTEAAGTIYAKAGINGGDGGKIETSGYGLKIDSARINASAPRGLGGLWYIDPADTTITQAVANSYAATLNTGTSVLNEVLNGSITWNSGVSLSKTAGGNATLTLRVSNTSAQAISLNNANIQSTSGALNLLMWAVNGGYQTLLSVNNSTINTNGGHFWMGGGTASSTLWNGLTVGNSTANSWSPDTQPISISGSTISTGAGSISLAGLSWDSGATTGTRNIGVLISGGSSISTTSGNISINGETRGRYTNGLGVHLGNTLPSSTTGNVSLSTTTGSISILGMGFDAANSGSGWRHGVSLFAKNAGEQVNVSTTSGNIVIDGRGEFTSAALATNNSAGLLLMSNNPTASVSVVSRTGGISLLGRNTLESSQYLNGFDLIAPNTSNAIRIGYDGTNAYSGNILIESNSIVQRNQNAGAGSISAQTSGTLTIRSAGAAFTALRAGASNTLTFDDDWNFGSSLGGFTLGKSTNTRDITLSSAITTTGPINLYGGTVTLNAGLTTTDTSTGDITIGAVNTLVTNSNFSLAAGRALSITNGGNSVYTGLISGNNARLIKLGAGTLSLTNANTYSGGTTLSGGRLGIYNTNSIGPGTVTAADGTSFVFGRAVNSFANNFVLNGNVTFDLDTSIDYLIAGGGGGGGAWVGGGGGGGGVLAGTSDLTNASYTINVGAGGEGMIYNSLALQRGSTSGGNSSAFGLTALGGGRGGNYSGFDATSGGSGGGQGSTQSAAAGTNGQGFAGGRGDGVATWGYVAGGGGGAGGAGGSATSARAGAGGVGLASTIDGALNYYGGGGGGGVHSSGGAATGFGGLGGGANGAVDTATPAPNGVANTGGGGGGTGRVSNLYSQGGNGGSGIVIARYLGASAGSGGTQTSGSGTASGYTLHRFTNTGSGTLSFNPIALTLSGTISGTGGPTVDASGGTINFTANNSYSGATGITGGVVQTNNANALGNNSAVTISNLATTRLEAQTSVNLGSLAGGGTTGGNVVLSTGANLTVGGNNTSTTYAGVISGAASLTKNGTGTFTLTGTNTYSGTTTISAGGIQIGTGSTLGAISNGDILLSGMLILNRSDNILLQNSISGTGSLTKLGAGTLSLTTANTYSGGTTLSAGTLGVYSNTAVGTGTVSAAAGTTVMFGRAVSNVANNFSLSGNVTFDFDNYVDYLIIGGGGGGSGGIGGGGGAGEFVSGGAQLTSTSYGVTVGNGGTGGVWASGSSGGASSAFGISAAGGGGGGVGFGTRGLNGGSGGGGGGAMTNGFGTSAKTGGGFGFNGGNGSLDGTGGNLAVAGGGGGAGGAGAASSGQMGGNGGAGRASDITGTSVMYAGGGGGGVNGQAGFSAGPVGLGQAGGGNAAPIEVNGVRSDGGNAAANSGSGGGGASNWINGGAGGSGIVIVRYLGGAASSGGTVSAGTGSAAAYTVQRFTTTGSNTLTMNPIAVTLGGTISGAGGVVTDATGGTLRFDGANSYTGATSITGGVVQTNHLSALGNNSALSISNVAGVRLEALSSLTLGSLAGSGTTGGNIALSSGAVLTAGGNNSSSTYSGVISGGGSLVKQGSGTMILANDHTFTGTTTISNGTLQLGDGGSTGAVLGDIINNGTLSLRFGADETLSNNISGSGNLLLTGVSSTLFSLNLTTTAQTIATNMTVAEVLYRLSGGRLSGTAITGGVSPREAGIHIKRFDPVTNTATFQIQQYDLAFTKGLFVRLTQSGNNVQAAINTSGPHSNGTVFTTPNIVGSDLSTGYTYWMDLATCYTCSGYGVDRLDLASKITLTGNLSYTGTTTLNNTTTTVTTGINQYSQTAVGTLQWNGAMPASGNLTNNGVLILNGSSAQTSVLAIAGTGTVIKNGSNTVTLSGAQTYTGDTVVNAGGLTIGAAGTTGSVSSSTNLYLPFAAATLTVNRSDDLTLSNLIRGVGSFSKAGNNNLTLTNNSLAAAFGISGGKLIIQNNTPPVSGNRFSGAGTLEIISAGTSFSSAFTTSGITFGSDLGGLTIGRSTNAVGITMASATNITGPISVTGSSVAVNANLSTTGANNGISLKATGGITQAASTTTQTNGGDITYWSNSGVDTMTSTAVGGVHLLDNATLDSRRTADRNANNISTATGGGTITLGGGSATTTTTLGTTVPSGYALNLSGTAAGLVLGTNTLVGHVSGIRILSGGGNIALSGRSTQTFGNITVGLQPYEGLIVNAGTNGNLRMRAIAAGAAASAGIDFQTYRAGTTSASVTTLQTAGTGSIEIYGLNTTTGSGIQSGVINANAGLTIAATGSGSLTITGISAAAGTADLMLQGTDLLAASGTITLNGGRSGAVLASSGPATTIGFRSGSLVTGSTSNIVTNFDTYSMSSGVTLNTTGTVAIQSFSDSFASALSWPTTNLTLGASVSGLRIGKPSNQSNVTLASATTIAGPVTVFGGDINVNSAINTSGGAANNRNILLQSSGTITQAANVAVTTGGGNVIYRANSDGQTSNGSIFLRDGSSISTGGGHLWLGGGSVDTTWNGLTVGDGFAVSGTAVQPVCTTACGTITTGIFLEAASLSSGGGHIGLRGRSTGAGYGITTIGNVLLNGGSGKIRLDGDTDSGLAIVAGVHFMFRSSLFNVQSTNTATDAIVVSGTANSGIGILTGPTRLEATNGGGISLSGTTTTGSIGTYFGYLNNVSTFAALANTGPITINGGASMVVEPSTTITLGQQASSSVTSSSSNIELIANAMTFRASDSIASSGSLTIRPATDNTTIGIAGGAGTLSLPATVFNNGTGVVKNGFSQITIGSATAGNVTFGGGLAFTDSTTVRTGGNITLNSGTAITNTQVGGLMVLAAGGNFINNAGATAVATTDAGATDRWIIYSANSANTTFGTPVLASGNSALWGSTFSSLAPADVASGNRYVFGNSPTVTVQTTNATKTYGDTLNLSNQLSMSIPSLVSGAFTQPTAADVFSTLPTVTSSGAAASASVNGGPYAITASGGVPRTGLSVTYSNVGQLTVLPRALTLTGTTTYSKVYDGSASASLTGALSGVLFNDAVGVSLSANFASANAGNNIAVTSTSTLTGAAASNYSLTQPAGLTANITKKSLTVTANNDAKFAGQADTAGYYGVSYAGFVNGESASALTTAPTLVRSNAASNIAGSYTGVLVPSGAAATNYSFNYVNGDYTIVPADQMLVRLAPVNNTYGTAPTLTVAEAKYMLPNNGGIVDLVTSGSATVTGNQIVVRDAANASATFSVSVVNGSNSGAGWLKAGSYQLAASNVTTSNGANFSNTVTLIGNQQVAPIALTPAPTISKVYDGSNSIAAFSGAATGVLTGDAVLLNGSGVFADKNAGSSKTYTLNGLNLSGADAANYSLSGGSTLTAANGTVTRRALSVSGIAANDKTYDGGTSATLNYAGIQYGGLIAGDLFGMTATGSFANANAGAQTVSISNPVYTGADAGNYLVTPQTSTSATITRKSLTLNGLVAANKVYDGTTSASITSFGTLTGVVGSDAVSLVSSQASASFANKQVGNGKAVTVLASSLGLSGAAAANYAVTVDPTTTANITAKSITVSGITAANKVYDGTTSASVSVASAVFNGMVSGDALTVSASGSFANKNAGIGKTVSLSSSYAGADLSNYSITDQASATATISPKALNVSGLVAESRVYDGTTSATVNNSNVLLSGLLAGDAVNVSATGVFANKNVGSNKVVTLSSSYSGADVANYVITDQASSSANITPKALTIAGITASNKTYDGTNSATVNSSAPIRTGLIVGDVVNVAATGTFSDENVGNTKTVTLLSSYSGADSGNYSITGQSTTTANITPLDVSLAGATGVTKVYDTNAALPAGAAGYGALSSASASVLATDMAVSGGLSLTGAPVFDSANAGNRVVQQGSVTLGGSRAGNYRLVWANGSGVIAQAPLTITANDDAKFYSEADTAGYAGVRYAGFVGGQTASTAGVLGGTLSVARDRTGLSGNNTQDVSGTYSGTLTPSGLTSSNYAINFAPGQYTIVPVGELLVKLQNITTTYGNTPNFVVSSARYMADDQNNAGSFVVTNLLNLGYVSVNGSTVTITDGSNPKASFDVAAVNGTLSSAGYLKAGAYALGASVIYNTSSDFTNTINIVGAWQVNQQGVTVNPTGVTKIYDGSAVMSNLALAPNGLVTPTVTGSLDQVSITGNGNFVDKNVTAQANKVYTLSGLTLTGVSSFGATVDDSSNYFLTNGATYVGSDGQITPRTLNVTYGGVNKVYDGLTSASVTTTDDRVTGDALGITRTAEFGNKNVGNGKNVYVTGVSLTGVDADNYTVNATSNTTADITPRPLVVDYSGINKVYDGTMSATVNASDDRVADDVLTITRSAAFADKNVGGAKTVSISGVTLSGTDAGNYSVTTTGTATANITQRSLSVTYAGVTKVYDGGTVVTVGVTDDRVVGDTLTINRTAEFADKNVGTSKAVAVSGVNLTGTDADNYSVVATGATTADITPKLLTVTYGGINKVYDGTTATTVTSSDDRVSGDVLSVLRSAEFSDKNVAVGKTVNVSGVSLSGTDATNYTVAATSTTTADITPRVLVVGYSGDNKIYDGGTVATVATSDDRVAGDVLSVVRTAAFADKNVGAAKAVSVSAVSLTGTDATNYSVASTGTTTADITPRTLNVTYSGAAKVYDGLLDATVSTTDDRVNGDVVTISRTASYADKNVADSKPVSVFGVGLGGADALNYTVAALGNTTANITPRALTPTFGGISKIYDGSTTAQVTSSDDRLVNDVFSIVRTGNFDDRHVGSGKTVTINGLSLTGTDAINYALTLSTATVTARIDQAASTSWIGGGATADWMDAGNWAGGVLPDRENVAAVTISETAIVSFGASAGTVSLTALAGPNMSLTQTGGSLSTSGAMTVGELWQSAGTLSVGNLLTVNSGFSQTGSGSITTSYGALINNSVGDLTIGNLTSNGPIELTNNDGGVSQIASTVLIAREGLAVTARTGDTPRPIDLSNAGNQISGGVSLSGSSTALRSTGPVSATLTGSDGGTLQTDDTLSVSGTLTGNSSHLILISPDVQLGGLRIGGNLGVTGPTTVAGTLDVGGSIDINGAAVLGASVTSGGVQRWRSTVDITSNVGITGDGLRFDSDLNGPHRLVLTDSGNTLIVGAIGNANAPLHFETNGAGTTTLIGGMVRTSGSASLVFNTDIVVTTDTVFDSTNNGALPGGAAITFARTLNGTSANTESVVLNAGTSGIVTSGAIGNSVPLKTLTLVNSGGATFGAVTTGTSAVIDATANGQWVNFAGNLQTPELLTRAGGYHLSMTGASNSVNSATTFFNTGRLVIGDAANDQSSFVGGLVATAPSAISLGGAISTSSAAINLGDSNTPLTLQAATVLSSNGGAIIFGGSVDSDATTARALTVNTGNGDVVFAGAVGDTNSVGAMAINSAGETRFEAAVDAASLTTDALGSVALNGARITTTGAITLNDRVALGDNTVIATTNSDIVFGQTVNSDSTARALTVTIGTGNVDFTGSVGATRTLGAMVINSAGETRFGDSVDAASLTTDALGSVVVNGSRITTTGNITLNDAVTLGTDTVLTGQAVTLSSTVDGSRSLTINASGATTFGGVVGGTTALTSVTTDAPGTLVLDGGAITVTGNITLNDAVTLGADAVLTGQAVTLSSTVDGARSLTINASGATIFGGVVGGATALTSLTTDAAGTLVLNGGAITATSNITLNDAVTLDIDTVLTAQGVTLPSTVDGAYSLTINASGATTFGGAIGGTTALTSLTTDAAGTLVLNGGSITTSGNIILNDAVTLGTDTVLTGQAVTLSSTVDGSRSLTINASGATTFGGVVGGTTALTNLTTDVAGTLVLNGGSITTTGAITLNDRVTLGDNTVIATTNSDIVFGQTVNSDSTARALTVTIGTGNVDFTGSVGATRTLGAMVINSAGETRFGDSVDAASLTTDALGSVVVNGSRITTTGNITLNDAVTLGTDTVLTGQAVTLSSTVNGAHALTINASGATTLGGVVGGATALTSLTTDAAGTLVLNGGSIKTLGNTTLNDAITLGASTTVAGQAVTLASTVNGAHALTINSSGATTLGGVVGGTTALTNLTTDAAGTLVLNGGSITTLGNTTLNDAITLGASTTVAGQAVTLASTVNGAHALTINASGATTLGGVVGGATALTSLTTDSAGTLVLNGGAITATGNITLNDAVTLGTDTVLTGQDVTLASTVDGARSLTINASGATTFGGAIGGTTALTSLTTDSAGTLVLNGGSITTSGNITLNDAVTLGIDTALTAQGVMLTSTVNGAHGLTINASGATTFGDAIGGTTALTSLTTDVAGTLSLNGSSITTSGAQSYGEAVTLGANTTLTAGSGNTGANITFASTVDRDANTPYSLTINAGNGDIRFMQAVGNVNTALGDLTINSSGETRFDAAVDAVSVTTNVGGTLSLKGSSITTSGDQSYGESVILGADTTLTAGSGNTGANINFVSTVDSDSTARTLTINAGTGTTALNDALGSVAPLAALSVSSGELTVSPISVLGSLDIATGGAMHFSDLNVGGDLSVSTGGGGVAGGVSQTANSTIIISGTSSFVADTTLAQDATLNNSTNDFGGSVSFANANGGSWRDVDIRDSQGGLTLASITATGSLTVQSDSGPITQAANAALTVGGASSFIASMNGAGTGAADILLGNAGNNFSGVVNLDGAQVSVRDSDALQLGQVTAVSDLAIQAAGDVSLGFTQVGGDLTIDTGAGNLTFGQTLVSGDSTITTGGGSISQTGRLNLLGNVALSAGTGSINLVNPSNNFGGALTLDAGSTSLATSADLTLGSVYNRGSLTLITQGNLQLGSATTVQGDLTLSSGGMLDLGTANVDGDLNLSSAGGAIRVGTANVAGDMSVASAGASVTLGQMQIAGDLTASTSGGNLSQTAAMSVGGLANFNVGSGQLDLSNTRNDFSGAVSMTAASATIQDVNALELGTLNVTGLLTATASNDLKLGSGSVGSLDATSQNASILQQAAGLTVSGTTDLVAADRIVLDSANNRLGPVTAEAAWVTLNAASALQIDRLLASQSATVSSAAVLTLGATTVGGDLEAVGATGIVQLAALNIGGAASFESSLGDIVLDAANNQFAGPVALAGNAVNVRAGSALQLGDVTARGDLKLETIGGPITQAEGAKLIAQADVNLKARNNGAAAAIILANADNDFVGIITADGAAIKLEDAVGKLKLGTINATGMLEAKAKGGSIVLEPGKLQLALGGMILTPDPRPSVVPVAQARVESLSGMGGSTAVAAKVNTVAAVGASSITLSATEQNVGASDGVIKVSNAPLVQSTRQVIPVGKVIALDTTTSEVNKLSAASFEIVDGLAPGATIEVPQTAVTAKVDNQTGKVVMSGDASVSDYDKAIQGIKLRVSDDAPPNAVIKIKITLTDGNGNVESKTVTVQVGQSEKISKNP